MKAKHRRLKIRYKRINRQNNNMKNFGRGRPLHPIRKIPREHPKLKVFYSFDYGDFSNGRIKPIRECHIAHFDVSPWEPVSEGNGRIISSKILHSIHECDVIIILIGKRTATRAWVRYEIAHGLAFGKGIVKIHINGLADSLGRFTSRGEDPLKYLRFKLDLQNNYIRIYERDKKNSHMKSKKFSLMRSFEINADKYPMQEKYLAGYYDDDIRTYDWVKDRGEENLEKWIAQAAYIPAMGSLI